MYVYIYIYIYIYITQYPPINVSVSIYGYRFHCSHVSQHHILRQLGALRGREGHSWTFKWKTHEGLGRSGLYWRCIYVSMYGQMYIYIYHIYHTHTCMACVYIYVYIYYILSIDMRIKYISNYIYIYDMVVHLSLYNESKMHIYYINMCYVWDNIYVCGYSTCLLVVNM